MNRFYCDKQLDPAAKLVRGVDVVAHRSCVRTKLLDCLRGRFGSSPSRLTTQRAQQERFIRECGFEPSEVFRKCKAALKVVS